MSNLITVTVCDSCGSDMCWQGRALCERSRSAGTVEVPACRYMSDYDGRQCLRPERMHTSGWSHAFVGESSLKSKRRLARAGVWNDATATPPPNEKDLLVRITGFGSRHEVTYHDAQGWAVELRNTERVTHWMEIPEVMA